MPPLLPHLRPPSFRPCLPGMACLDLISTPPTSSGPHSFWLLAHACPYIRIVTTGRLDRSGFSHCRARPQSVRQADRRVRAESLPCHEGFLRVAQCRIRLLDAFPLSPPHAVPRIHCPQAKTLHDIGPPRYSARLSDDPPSCVNTRVKDATIC